MKDRPPCVWETGGRLLARANFLGKSSDDLHVAPNGKVCLGLPEIVDLKARRYPGVRNFFVHQIAPYFYYHAYREKHDDKEPWRGLSHEQKLATLEQIGIDQDDTESLNMLLPLAVHKRLPKNIILADSQLVQCWCEKKKRMAECHPDAALGHKILRDKAIPKMIPATPSWWLAILQQIGLDRNNPESLKILLPLAAEKLQQNIIPADSQWVRCVCGEMKRMAECHPDAALGHKVLKDKSPSSITSASPSLRPYLRPPKKRRKKGRKSGR